MPGDTLRDQTFPPAEIATQYTDYINEPLVLVPGPLSDVDPAWKHCPMGVGAIGLFDPPRALVPADDLISPWSKTEASLASAVPQEAAKPASPVSNPAAVQTSVVAELGNGDQIVGIHDPKKGEEAVKPGKKGSHDHEPQNNELATDQATNDSPETDQPVTNGAEDAHQPLPFDPNRTATPISNDDNRNGQAQAVHPGDVSSDNQGSPSPAQDSRQDPHAGEASPVKQGSPASSSEKGEDSQADHVPNAQSPNTPVEQNPQPKEAGSIGTPHNVGDAIMAGFGPPTSPQSNTHGQAESGVNGGSSSPQNGHTPGVAPAGNIDSAQGESQAQTEGDLGDPSNHQTGHGSSSSPTGATDSQSGSQAQTGGDADNSSNPRKGHASGVFPVGNTGSAKNEAHSGPGASDTDTSASRDPHQAASPIIAGGTGKGREASSDSSANALTEPSAGEGAASTFSIDGHEVNVLPNALGQGMNAGGSQNPQPAGGASNAVAGNHETHNNAAQDAETFSEKPNVPVAGNNDSSNPTPFETHPLSPTTANQTPDLSIPDSDSSPEKDAKAANAPQILPNSAVAVAGTALTAGGPGATISGTPITVLPGNAGVVVGPNTIQPAPISTPAPIVVGGQSFTPVGDGAGVVVEGTTLSLGGEKMTLSSGEVAKVEQGGLVVGSQTVPIPVPTLSIPATAAAASEEEASSADRNINTFHPIVIIDGQTLTNPTSQILTLDDGSPASVNRDGVLVIGSETVALPSGSNGGGHTIAPGSRTTHHPSTPQASNTAQDPQTLPNGNILYHGATLSRGGPAVTLADEEVVSLAASPSSSSPSSGAAVSGTATSRRIGVGFESTAAGGGAAAPTGTGGAGDGNGVEDAVSSGGVRTRKLAMGWGLGGGMSVMDGVGIGMVMVLAMGL